MKIISGKYKQEPNIPKYLAFKPAASSEISLVLAQRLAAWVRDVWPGRMLLIASGYRTYAQQVISKQTWPELAATPGTSWHEYHLAVDVASECNDMMMADYSKTYNAQSLYKYGLYIPMNKVDSPKMLELWHITPIECKGIAVALRKTFLQSDDLIYNPKGGDIMQKGDSGEAVYDYQWACKTIGFKMGVWSDMKTKAPTGCDGDYGNDMIRVTKEVQKKYGLPQTGVVDSTTFGSVIKSLTGMVNGTKGEVSALKIQVSNKDTLLKDQVKQVAVLKNKIATAQNVLK